MKKFFSEFCPKRKIRFTTDYWLGDWINCNPINVNPCPLCPTLKKQLENLAEQIQNLTAEKNNLGSEKETIQKQLSELENKPPAPKKAVVRQAKDQPLKVDLDQLEKETGLKKDWKNPAWNRAWKNAYNKTPTAREQKRLWQRKNHKNK